MAQHSSSLVTPFHPPGPPGAHCHTGDTGGNTVTLEQADNVTSITTTVTTIVRTSVIIRVSTNVTTTVTLLCYTSVTTRKGGQEIFLSNTIFHFIDHRK